MFGGGSTMAPPTVGDLSALSNLLELLRDPQKTKEMVGKLTEAAKKSEAALAQVMQEQRKLDESRAAYAAAIARERKEHDAALTKERTNWNSEHGARLAEIERMEAQARSALEKAEKDGKAAAQMRRDLEVRLKKLHELAA